MNEKLQKLLEEKSDLYDRIEAQAAFFGSSDFRALDADAKSAKVRERGATMSRMREVQEEIAAIRAAE